MMESIKSISMKRLATEIGMDRPARRRIENQGKTMSTIDEEKLVKRAHTAYLKAGGNMQPSIDTCSVEQVGDATYVALRNTYEILAVFQYKRDSLMRISEWPESIK
jgi:hypothetical protein